MQLLVLPPPPPTSIVTTRLRMPPGGGTAIEAGAEVGATRFRLTILVGLGDCLFMVSRSFQAGTAASRAGAVEESFVPVDVMSSVVSVRMDDCRSNFLSTAGGAEVEIVVAVAAFVIPILLDFLLMVRLMLAVPSLLLSRLVRLLLPDAASSSSSVLALRCCWLSPLDMLRALADSDNPGRAADEFLACLYCSNDDLRRTLLE
jgi:hypothetical protein